MLELSVQELAQQEIECQLPSFDSQVAWKLGCIIRKNVQEKFTRAAVIYIAHANSSQVYFFAPSRPGTLPDNMLWVKRKEAVVLRWGVSTFLMRQKLLDSNRSLQQAYEVSDPSAYAVHGGGFPIRVKGVEGVVGVVVVSGLHQDEDHSVIVDAIKEYLKEEEA